MVQTKNRAKPFDFLGGLPDIGAFSCPGCAFGWGFPAYFQEIGINQIFDDVPVPLTRHVSSLGGRVLRHSTRLRDSAPDRIVTLRNVTDLDLHLLHIFTCVAKCGGFTAAQVELNMSQSNISMHIASLEKHLGYRPCGRGKSGFRLIAKGYWVLEASQTMFDAIGLFHDQAQASSECLVGELYLGLADNLATLPQARLGNVSARFWRRDRDAQLSLLVSSPTELELVVIKGELNLAISCFSRSRPSLEYRLLYREETGVFCGDRYPLFAEAQPTLKRIATCDWAMHGFPSKNLVLPLRPSRSRATAYHMEAVAHAVLAGIHLGYLPTHYAEAQVERRRMHALLPERLSYSVERNMIVYARRLPSEAARAFIDDLLQVHGLGA